MTTYAPANASSPVLDVADVVALEQRIASEGTPLSELMERAGAALAEFAAQAAGKDAAILFLCGSGNNGGDGWVAARILSEQGRKVCLASPRPAGELRAEPARSAALDCMRQRGHAIGLLIGDEARPENFGAPGLIVDCMLGTGFNAGDVRQPYAAWIEWAAGQKAFKLACDAPSGLSAQTGEAAGPCFAADATVTMLAVKTGLTADAAAPYVGELFLAPLGCGTAV